MQIKTKNIYNKVIIKIGSDALTLENGMPDENTMHNLAESISFLHSRGVKVLLVSSGAVAFGKSITTIKKNEDNTIRNQVYSAIGQAKLINEYTKLFSKHNIKIAQLLVTKLDFDKRYHFIGMRNCLNEILSNNILPIINENDVMSVKMSFTDNDELSGLFASMVQADAVFFLTNTEGVYNKNPNEVDATLIEKVEYGFKNNISFKDGSKLGRGGMISKYKISLKLAKFGINVHIFNGKTKGNIEKIFEGKSIGTYFVPRREISGIRQWISAAKGYEKGIITINKGAAEKISSKDTAASLLPIGITDIKGDFKKGDVLKIIDENNNMLGFGMAQYAVDVANELKGLKGKKPLIHYNYLFINEEYE